MTAHRAKEECVRDENLCETERRKFEGEALEVEEFEGETFESERRRGRKFEGEDESVKKKGRWKNSIEKSFGKELVEARVWKDESLKEKNKEC